VGPRASLYVWKREDSLVWNSGPSVPLPGHYSDYTIPTPNSAKRSEVSQILNVHCMVSGVKGMAWLLDDF
jgi:hypothetical protein